MNLDRTIKTLEAVKDLSPCKACIGDDFDNKFCKNEDCPLFDPHITSTVLWYNAIDCAIRYLKAVKRREI